MDAVFTEEIMRLFNGLDGLSYYEYLGLRPGCDYVAVREGFYARAQRFHPDQFVHYSGASLKQAVYEVYKRMTESYNVLLDPELRLAYDKTLASGQVRLSEVSRARRITAEERQVSNALARIYLRSAKKKLARGRMLEAWIDARLALSLESAPPLHTLLQLIESQPGGTPGGRA
ncbi:MAG: DnaJ domain-containing protein [Nannocystaceae bacterium]|nr:DnaJ domain-containing protein [Nannocystaceae bacterium]